MPCLFRYLELFRISEQYFQTIRCFGFRSSMRKAFQRITASFFDEKLGLDRRQPLA